MVAIFDTFPFSPFSHLKMRTNWTAFKKSCHFQFDTVIILYSVAFVYLRSEIKKKFIGLRLWLTSLLKNTGQPEKRDIFMKNGNESRDVLGDSRKRYRCPWAEIGKYWPGKEPIRLQDLLPLPCPLKKKKQNKEYYDTANDFNCASVRQNPIVHMYDASANKCLVVWRFLRCLFSVSSRLRWTSKSSKRKAN